MSKTMYWCPLQPFCYSVIYDKIPRSASPIFTSRVLSRDNYKKRAMGVYDPAVCVPTIDLHYHIDTVYPKKYAHGFVVLCFVVVMQSFIVSSHEVFIHIHQGCFAGTGTIVRLPQCQWSKPDGYGKISQCITTTKHSKAKTVCIFLGIYCNTHSCFVVPDVDPWPDIRSRHLVEWS